MVQIRRRTRSASRFVAYLRRSRVFINFYLSFVDEEIADAGYFPAPAADLDAAKSAWLEAAGQ
jgi:hypothetical protein